MMIINEISNFFCFKQSTSVLWQFPIFSSIESMQWAIHEVQYNVFIFFINISPAFLYALSIAGHHLNGYIFPRFLQQPHEAIRKIFECI
ncbi:hypothetical protein Hanom_Chr03g00253841 [Helianthus anomalus]